MTKDNIIDLSQKKKEKEDNELSDTEKVGIYLFNLKAYEVPMTIPPFFEVKKIFSYVGEMVIKSDFVHKYHPYDYAKERVIIKTDLFEYNKFEDEDFFKVELENIFNTPTIFYYKKIVLDLETQSKREISFITEEIFRVLPEYEKYIQSTGLWQKFKNKLFK